MWAGRMNIAGNFKYCLGVCIELQLVLFLSANWTLVGTAGPVSVIITVVILHIRAVTFKGQFYQEIQLKLYCYHQAVNLVI